MEQQQQQQQQQESNIQETTPTKRNANISSIENIEYMYGIFYFAF